jgi:hypothetical protein
MPMLQLMLMLMRISLHAHAHLSPCLCASLSKTHVSMPLDAAQLAGGLGSDFNLHARGLMLVLLDKLKDTNRAVVEGVQSCLDTFLLVSLSLNPKSCLDTSLLESQSCFRV